MYRVEKPSSLMLPRSPPEPFTHSTSTCSPLSGSAIMILAEVFPPPKFVMRRSDPSRFERYSSSSGSLMPAASCSSHRDAIGSFFVSLSALIQSPCFELMRHLDGGLATATSRNHPPGSVNGETINFLSKREIIKSVIGLTVM